MGVVWSSFRPSSPMGREKEGWRQPEGGGGTEREAFLCKHWDPVADWPGQSHRVAWGPSTGSGFQEGLACIRELLLPGPPDLPSHFRFSPSSPGGCNERSRSQVLVRYGSSLPAKESCHESPCLCLCPPRSSSTPTRCCCPSWGQPSHRPGLLEAARSDGHWAIQWSQCYRLRRVRKRAEGEFLSGWCSHPGPSATAHHSAGGDPPSLLNPQDPLAVTKHPLHCHPRPSCRTRRTSIFFCFILFPECSLPLSHTDYLPQSDGSSFSCSPLGTKNSPLLSPTTSGPPQ